MKRTNLIMVGMAIVLIVLGIYWLAQKRTGIIGSGETAAEIKQELIGTWIEKNRINGDRFTFSDSPLEFIEETTRQVAPNKGEKELPFPTICRIKHISKNYRVEPCTQEVRKDCGQAKNILTYHVNQIELVPDQSNGKACPVFINKQRAYIAKSQTLNYSYLIYRDKTDGGLMIRTSTAYAAFQKENH